MHRRTGTDLLTSIKDFCFDTNNFFLFPKMKEILKGRHFDDIDGISGNTTAALKAIPQNQF